MGLVRTVDPTEEPVSLITCKEYLKVTTSADNILIDGLIESARKYIEDYLAKTLVTTTWSYTIDEYPDVIELPMSPVASITSIKYVDEDGAEQTWASDQYRTDLVSNPARITRAYNVSYPTIRLVTNAISIVFVAGTAASSVPQEYKTALMQLVATHYDNRWSIITGKTVADMPHSFLHLLRPTRIVEF